MSLVLLALSAAGDVQEGPEAARRWYNRMGAALKAATSVHVESRSRSLGADSDDRWTYFLEGPRVSLTGRIGKERVPVFRTVSDGKRYVMEPFPTPEAAEAPEGFAAKALLWFAQFGCAPSLPSPPGAADDSTPALCQFALKEPETLDGRAVRGVRYRASWDGSAEGYEITLWLDAKSALPVKRSVRSTFRWSTVKGKEGRFVGFDEDYTLVILNEPVPERTFQVD